MGRFSKLEWESGDKSKKETLEEKETLLSQAPEEAEIYDYHYYIHKAGNFYYTGEFKNALRQYSRALQFDNSQRDPWIGQIQCLISLNQMKEADLWISRGLEVFPEDPLILSLRGVIYAYRGMIKRAIATSDYALTKKRAADPLIWIARGEILLMADNDNASHCFEKALEMINKDDWENLMLIGLVFFRKKQYSQASKYFQNACLINISNFYLWYYLGLTYEKLGFAQKAIDAYQRSIENNQRFRESSIALYRITHTSILKKIILLPFLPIKIIMKVFAQKKIN